MARFINLNMSVGRAAAQCLGSFDCDKNPVAVAEAQADAAQAVALHARIAEGVDPARVSFERIYVETDDKERHESRSGFRAKKGK